MADVVASLWGMNDKMIDGLEAAHREAGARRTEALRVLHAHVEAHREAIQELHRLDYAAKFAGAEVSSAYDAMRSGYAAAYAAQREETRRS